MAAARSRRRGLDSTAALALRAQPPQAAAELSNFDMGDSASEAALAKLDGAIAGLRAMRIAPLLKDAVAAIRTGDSARASEIAIEALGVDDKSGHAWHLLAIAREHCDDFKSSISAYEAALALLPDHADVANDLGRLAFRLGMTDVAAQLFALYREARPTCAQGANNLACALRDLHQYQAAIDVLKPAIEAEPTSALLWNTLATVVIARGDTAAAIPFLSEAISLEPGFAKPRYTRANARVEFGDIDGALADLDAAIAASAFESDRAMMRFARAHTLLVGGRLVEGWDAYETRFAPQFAGRVTFLIDRPLWTPETALNGRSLLLVGEQGLGDEVMFANVLPDVIEALGPKGRLCVAVERRLAPLFRRSFPGVEFAAHADVKLDGHNYRLAQEVDAGQFDFWAPLAAPLRKFRPSVESFPDRTAYLTPDPARTAHWRAALEALPGRKVGILWKSLKLDGARLREFSPFEGWRPVLATPGVTFVNLQYGECEAELEQARRSFGVDVWRPPGIDLKDDLDDLASLCCALDVVLGPANATTNIAAACGAESWFISTPMAWPRLGCDHYPWYPAARAFIARAYGQWDSVMGEVAAALKESS